MCLWCPLTAMDVVIVFSLISLYVPIHICNSRIPSQQAALNHISQHFSHVDTNLYHTGSELESPRTTAEQYYQSAVFARDLVIYSPGDVSTALRIVMSQRRLVDSASGRGNSESNAAVSPHCSARRTSHGTSRQHNVQIKWHRQQRAAVIRSAGGRALRCAVLRDI